MRKIIPFLLTVFLAVMPMVGRACAAESETVLAASIREQFEAYADSIEQTGADDKAIDVFLDHAWSGKDIIADEYDAITAVVLNSQLYTEAFVDAVTAAIQRMNDTETTDKFLRGGTSWYEHRMSYSYQNYEDNENGDEEDDRALGGVAMNKGYTGATNRHDDTLMLLAGGTSCRITLRRQSITVDQIVYRVELEVRDTFDFDGDYNTAADKGYDTSKAKLLTVLGQLMGMQEFQWRVKTQFELAVPNTCDHMLKNYRWSYDEGKLVGVEGFDDNPATPILEAGNTGAVTGPYFALDETVGLYHDRPWVVEFTCQGWMYVFLNGNKSLSGGDLYIMRTTNNARHYLFVGEHVVFQPTQEEKEKYGLTVDTAGRNDRYGIDYTELYTRDQPQTYRLENRIAEDGSNAVWLLIDGAEMGVMEDRYVYCGTSINQYEDTVSGWFNGKNMFINYIGNCNLTLSTALHDLPIYEAGEQGVCSAIVEETTRPTCTQDGCTTYTCTLCGYSYEEARTEATGHDCGGAEIVWGDSAAAALAQCGTCGEKIRETCAMDADYSAPGVMRVTASALGVSETVAVTAHRAGDTVTVTLPEGFETVQVLAAAYDESGRMTDSRMAQVAGNQAAVPLNGENVKLFFLGGENWEPVLPCLHLN